MTLITSVGWSKGKEEMRGEEEEEKEEGGVDGWRYGGLWKNSGLYWRRVTFRALTPHQVLDSDEKEAGAKL